jgi:hypothetical protein
MSFIIASRQDVVSTREFDTDGLEIVVSTTGVPPESQTLGAARLRQHSVAR